MSEEQAQQSEAPVESQETASEPTEQPSYEDIAKKFSIEEQVQSFTAQPVPQSQPTYPSEPVRVPDPVLDQEGWAKHYANQNAQVANTLKSISDSMQEIRREQAQERLNADVNKAVARLNDKLKVDNDMAEVLLEVEYRKNPVFKRIWDNRHSKPEALAEALDVLGTKTAGKFAVRTDPQLVENQRAAKTGQKAMASTANKSQSDDIMNMSDAEFERFWAQNKGF